MNFNKKIISQAESIVRSLRDETHKKLFCYADVTSRQNLGYVFVVFNPSFVENKRRKQIARIFAFACRFFPPQASGA